MNEMKKKNSQKNNKLKKGTALLFAGAVITTGLLGTTLAKYVSDLGTQSDQARVARWGVTGEDSSLDLFATAYDQTVKSSSVSEKVIAPGTSGSVELIPNIKAPGTGKETEVAYQVKYSIPFAKDKDGNDTGDLDFGYKGNWAVSDGFGWWPLQFDLKVYKDGVIVDSYTYEGIGNSADDGDTQLEAIKTKLNGLESNVIYPGATATTPLKAVLSWSWPFERVPSTDKWDTEVGNNAMVDSSDDTMPKFVLKLKASAVQVD